MAKRTIRQRRGGRKPSSKVNVRKSPVVGRRGRRKSAGTAVGGSRAQKRTGPLSGNWGARKRNAHTSRTAKTKSKS